jgi:hypothetical protein
MAGLGNYNLLKVLSEPNGKKGSKPKSSPQGVAEKIPKAAKSRKTAIPADFADQARRAATLLKQVSDPARFLVVILLDKYGELQVGAICERLNQSQAATR